MTQGLDEVLVAFRVDQERRGLTARTISKREAALRRFSAYLAPRCLSEATTSDVDAWMESRSLAPSTISSLRACLRVYFEWWSATTGVPPVLPRIVEDGRVRRQVRTGVELPAVTTATLAAWRVSLERRAVRPSSIARMVDIVRLLAEEVAPGPVLDATREDIEAWLDARKLAPRTRYTYISTVHRLFEWAILEEMVECDPTLRIVRPRLPRRAARPLSDQDLSDALAAAPADVAAMLALAAYAGLRCSEIAGVHREDILEHNVPPVLVVAEGKGGHQRVIPLHPRIWEALQRSGLPWSGPLFHRADRRPLAGWAVSQRINQYLHAIGIAGTAHQARHWFGTNVYRATRDLRATQELLGHASPVTTTGYVALAAVDTAEAVASL